VQEPTHQPSATYDLINGVWGDDSPDVGASGAPGPFIKVSGQDQPPVLPSWHQTALYVSRQRILHTVIHACSI